MSVEHSHTGVSCMKRCHPPYSADGVVRNYVPIMSICETIHEDAVCFDTVERPVVGMTFLDLLPRLPKLRQQTCTPRVQFACRYVASSLLSLVRRAKVFPCV